MFLILSLALSLGAQQPAAVPAGYWPESQSGPILEKTETIRLAPDLSGLDESEQAALKDLIEVGHIMHELDTSQRHREAARGLDKLRRVHMQTGQTKRTENLLQLYRLFGGPIALTLDNQKEAFIPVSQQMPGRNLYPFDVTREELDGYLAAKPNARAQILDARSVVRRANRPNVAADIQALRRFPVLRALHPTLLDRLQKISPLEEPFYAVPYAIAYADQLVRASRHLTRAADNIETSDAELARYLRNRARDLMSNDYESGDASWVTGRFERFNVVIGAYETYDDALFGVKAFHQMSILLRNQKATAELRRALGGLQAIEDALPYDRHKRVREDIPVGVYDVVADFGEARGTNTAAILPNDPLFSRRYGRTILLRENLIKHPDFVNADRRIWRAATAEPHANDLDAEGAFQRTLWHEIGHYLGPNDDALEEYAASLEEMKADLISLFALHRMNHPALRDIQASGINRTLQNVKPRGDQPYLQMQLVQFNWFLDQGLIAADPKTARLTINYDRYGDTVSALLAEVLRLQGRGDKTVTAAFFERWTAWTPELHEKLAARIRDAQGARFWIVRYAALSD